MGNDPLSAAGRRLVSLALLAGLFAEDRWWEDLERDRGRLLWLRSDGSRR